MGEEAILCKHWAKGSAGIEELANKVVALAEGGASQFAPLYPDDMPLFEKINTIVQRIYRGSEAIADKSVRDQLHAWEQAGYGNLPVCMAKTQYSFSTDPNLRGAPTGHVVPVREVRLSAGAGFVVVICGEIMTMPGLPKAPSAKRSSSTRRARSKGCSKISRPPLVNCGDNFRNHLGRSDYPEFWLWMTRWTISSQQALAGHLPGQS